MSRKRKTAKAAPIKLIWLEQIIEHEWPDKPARPTIFAVAATLVTYGDRAGRGICPAVQTIAAPMRVKRQTVIDVLSLMVAEGVLVRRGKTHYGTNIYDMKIAAKATDTDTEAVPQAVPRAVTSTGTQSSSLDRKGERDDEYSPTAAAEAAAAGIDTETPEAEAEITTFIAAFTPIFAERPRSSKTPIAALEPSHRGLRAAIITKITAGWPHDHLIERTLIGITADERKIGSLSSVVATILNRLPAKPDHAARVAIHAAQLKTQNTTPTKSRAKAVAAVTAELHDTSSQICDIINEIASLNEPDDDERSYRVVCQLWSDYRAAETEHLGDLSTNELDPHEYITTENLDTYGVKVREFYQLHLKALTRRRTSLQRAAQRQAQRSTTK